MSMVSIPRTTTFKRKETRQRNFTGFHFWGGYCVSTVGLDEQTVRAYIRTQEVEEKRQEQSQLRGL